MSEAISVVRAGGPTGEYDPVTGHAIVGPDVTSSIEVNAFAPGSSDESGENAGQKVLSGGTIYAFPGTVFASTDRLIIRGETWQVEGDAAEWISPYSDESKGILIAVKRSP